MTRNTKFEGKKVLISQHWRGLFTPRVNIYCMRNNRNNCFLLS